jgi:biofilm protein TabA
MILDTLIHSATYAKISGHLKTGFDWLVSNPLETLAAGTYEVDGNCVKAMVQTYDAIDPSMAKLEAHLQYIDIQYVISGTEGMLWTPVEGLTPVTDYDMEKDIRFYADRPCTNLVVGPGQFAVFFPADAHKPRGIVTRSESIHKVVVKVAVE